EEGAEWVGGAAKCAPALGKTANCQTPVSLTLAREPLWRKPTTGIAGCCPRATSGHAAAAPLSSVMNSRRLMSDMGRAPPALCQRRPWLYGWFAAIQGITERTAGPWATPEMF